MITSLPFKSIKNYLLCLGIGLGLAFTKHDVYLSSMEIVVQPPDRDLQITLRVFTDDLELVLQQQHDLELKLNPDHSASAVDSIAAIYLARVIQLKSRDSLVTLNFLGKEYRDDLTLLYWEGQLDATTTDLQLTHRLFLDALPTQQNVVHFKQAGQRKSYLFDKRVFEKTLVFVP